MTGEGSDEELEEKRDRCTCVHRCAVIEDSHIGLNAAKSAGMTCFVTKSSYTGNEDFRGADGIFDCIGEVGEERFSLVDLSNSVSAVDAPDELRHLEIELEQPATAGSQDSQGLANAEWEHLWNR
eukprot:gene8227-1493_t